MNRRNGMIVVSLLLGFVWAYVIQLASIATLLTPLWWVGAQLRGLSLSGMVGNVVAWAVLLVVAAMPLWYGGRRYAKGCSTKVDIVLPVLSVQSFVLLYFLVNPTLVQYPGDLPLADGFALLYVWALVATAVGYILLRLLQYISKADGQACGRLLPTLLQVSGFILVGVFGCQELAILLARVQTVTDANTGSVTFTVVVLIALAVCQLLPAVFGGITLLWSADVAVLLLQAPYAEETIDLCATVARRCNWVAVGAVVVSTGCNIAQVVFASALYQMNIMLDLPMLTLLLSAVLSLLCHYMQGAKRIVDDNNSII